MSAARTNRSVGGGARDLICVAITAESTDKALIDIERALARADLVELRLDFIKGAIELDKLIAASRGRAIATCRARDEGGRWRGAEEERIALLLAAADLGAAYVDVELSHLASLPRRPECKLVLSHHDFEKMPADLPDIADRMDKAGADVVKVVATAGDAADNLAVLDVLRRSAKPAVALAMGEYGIPSRILARKFGAAWTYASLARGAESAPGQLTIDDMLDLYRFKSTGPDTAVYGVIGNPVAHSASPAVMNAAFAEMGLDAVYLLIRVSDVKAFVSAFKKIPLEGCSVTIPHKSAVMDYVDKIDPLARRVGAVNTVLREGDGTLTGCNTDLEGAMSALEEALGGKSLKDSRALVLGAGGAARAIVFGLVDRGADVIIANRTVSRAEALAGDAGTAWCAVEEAPGKRFDILVNCTSVGMHPNENASPISADCLREGMVVFDTVYNPPETRLLAAARRRGARTVSGLEMFLRQAEKQIAHWTGLPAPRDVMEKALCRKLGLE